MKSLLVPARGDGVLLSPVFILVNNVEVAGLSYSYSMEPSWLTELIFESSHRTWAQWSVRTAKEVVKEFDDVLAAAFDDGVEPHVGKCGSVGISRAIASSIFR